MLRPIENSLSLYNVELKANQVKDPNAHQQQAMQQAEIGKQAEQRAQTVQALEKTEAEVKIRERKDGRGNGGGGGGKRRRDGQGEEPEGSDEKQAASGGLDFLA